MLSKQTVFSFFNLIFIGVYITWTSKILIIITVTNYAKNIKWYKNNINLRNTFQVKSHLYTQQVSKDRIIHSETLTRVLPQLWQKRLQSF